MKYLVPAIVLVFASAEGALADEYELTPLTSWTTLRAALVFNETTGDIYSCVASYALNRHKMSLNLVCSKSIVDHGQVPPGPGAVSPFPPQPPAPVPGFPSFWKINPSSGDVTFCGGFKDIEEPPWHYVCVTKSLPTH